LVGFILGKSMTAGIGVAYVGDIWVVLLIAGPIDPNNPVP
jgi:hypothetical protein